MNAGRNPGGAARVYLVVKRLTAAFFAVVALSGCTGGGDRDEEPQVGPLLYGVSYTVGPDQYDDADATRRYEPCADLPGATSEAEELSLPPGRMLRFVGSEAEQRAVVECLNRLPDANVNGPFPPPP